MTIAQKWTPEEQDQLRAQVREIMQAEGLKQTQVAQEVGLAYGTFTPWLAGNYAGSTEDKAIAVAKWVDARAEKKRVAQQLPAAPAFQETPSAARMLRLMRYCHFAPDIGVVAGGAGIGKTTTAREYQRRAPNVFIVTGEPVMSSPANFLVEVSAELGLPEVTPQKMARAITRKLRGSGALLIVDEAQHLTTTTLNQARAIHDASDCGLVFLGNETVYSRMGDGRAEFAQLFSRVGSKVTQPRPKPEDVDALLAAWGLDIDKKLPRAIAQKPGALRGLTKTLRIAHVLAAGKAETVTTEHLRAAWDQIGFDRIDA